MKKIIGMFFTIVFITILSTISFAGEFVQDNIGIRYDVGGGRYLKNGYAWIDVLNVGIGYCYYFNSYGYMAINAVTPDGSFSDAAGRVCSNTISVPLTKTITKDGYEIITASYPTYPDSKAAQNSTVLNNNTPLANRIISSSNVQITTFPYIGTNYPNAVEFTESVNPYIVFNSGLNTSLTFDVVGDNIAEPADFIMEVYVNDVRVDRFGQKFADKTTHTIYFSADQYIEIRIPIINDDLETYYRKIYIINANFG